jgi:hypothetical protein
MLPKWRWLFAILLATFEVAILSLLMYHRYHRIGNTTFTCGSVFGLICLVIALKSTNYVILIFENGLKIRDAGGVVEARWDELTEIQEKRFFLWKITGLFVLTPTRNEIPLSIYKRGLNTISFPINIQRSAFIPLTLFADDWRNSDLGQQIKQHAPHLFEKEKSADKF